MTKEFKLLMISMPNFIAVEKPARPRQEGVDFTNQGVPVGELTHEEAEGYAEEMKQAFLQHWAKKSEE